MSKGEGGEGERGGPAIADQAEALGEVKFPALLERRGWRASGWRRLGPCTMWQLFKAFE